MRVVVPSVARLLTPLLVPVLVAGGCAPGDKDAGTDSDSDAGLDDTSSGPGDTGSGDDSDALPDEPTAIDCADAPAAVTGGDCAVTEGTGSALLLHVDTVLGPVETFEGGGQVLIDGAGTIVCAGCGCDADPVAADATVVTCPTGVASPGLINAHDHVTFDEQAPYAPSPTRYDHRHEWRAILPQPGNANADGTRWSEARQLMAGTTSMLGSGATDGFVRNMDRSGRDEGLGINVSNQTFPLGDGNRQFRADCGWSYAEGELAVAGQDAWIGHVSEGIDAYAAEEIRCLSTSFDDGQDLTEDNTAHVHAVGLQAVDYAEMAREGTLLVWSPRTNIRLYGHTAQVRLFKALGGDIALGSDWTYTGSATILRELQCADAFDDTYLDDAFSSVDLWRMATEYGAVAIGAKGVLGRLQAGYVGDVAVFDGTDRPAHRAVIEADQQDTLLVLRGGLVQFGDAAAVQALDPSCDAVDVCGAARAICSDREIGQDWAAFAGTMASKYPAIFCGTPADEPTCVPSRPGEFDGTATATDADGDGLADGDDNCPSVFNPVRPMDYGTQPDADEDGIGDACDDTPLPADLDADGVDNDLDVCWRDADVAQADADMDGKGDVCDPCPDTPNPDGPCTAPPVSIPTAKAESDGASVTVEGVVTGVFSNGQGFFIQDPTVSSGIDAGIRVLVGGGSLPDRGDRVQVSGALDTYFTSRELDASTVRAVGTGTITPVSLTVSQATGEDYEGVLVTLTDATVSDADHDCSADNGGCSDDDLWEVGGPTGIVVDKRVFEDADSAWTAGIDDGTLTGVMDIRFDRRRIHPRIAADLP